MLYSKIYYNKIVNFSMDRAWKINAIIYLKEII